MRSVTPHFSAAIGLSMVLGLSSPGESGKALAADIGPGGVPFADFGRSSNEKPDLAHVDFSVPIPPTVLRELKTDDLLKMNQEQLDQLYARLHSGPVPSGVYDGKIVLANDGGLKRLAALAVEMKLQGGVDFGTKVLDFFVAGKNFYKRQGIVRNRIEHARWLSFPIAPFGVRWDEVPMSTIGNSTAHELFPAKYYCGQSLLDSRRESIVIDYAYNDDIAGYQPKLDYLMNRSGALIRDEMRMIRPGFYLARMYANRVFLMNYVLHSDGAEIANHSDDACWSPPMANQR